MTRKYTRRTLETSKIASSGEGFEKLVSRVPVEQFVRMVTKANLPSAEARELCQLFKELKQ